MYDQATPTNTACMDRHALHDALERLHAESFGWALACCAQDRSLAADVLQTTYVKVLEGRAAFAGAASFRTWLFAIIRHTAVDMRRKQRVRALFRIQPTTSQTSPIQPDALLETTETQAHFRALLTQLPLRQQEVLHLVFYHDLTVQKAAEVMGVSIGSARTHYARGKARLRTWLTDEHEVFPHG